MSEREEYSGDLSAYLDGELSESKRLHLDEVLKYDRELAGEMDRLRATRELIHSLPTEQPPRDFVAHVVTRAERTHLLGSLRQPRSYRWITLAAAAVVLVAAGLSVVIMQKLPWGQPTDPSHEKVGDLALVVDKPVNGDVAKTYDKKDGKVVMPGTPKGPGKEMAGYRFGKGGPEDGKLGEKALTNGRESGVVTGPGWGMKSGDPLERTLDKARRAAARLSGKGDGKGDFVIYTSNLAFAQRDVENVLAYNGIHPVRTQDAESDKDISGRMSRGNFFNAKQTTVRQVQYEVFASPKQAVKLKNELNVIRAQQEVSQAITPPPAIVAAIAPKATQVARGRTGTDAAAADEEAAGRKTRSKAKYVSKPKSADDDHKKAAVVFDTDQTREAKAEAELIAEGKPTTKDEPSPKTAGQKPAERPRPTTKPGPPGVAVAAQTGEGLSLLPTTTPPARGTLAARKILEKPQLEPRGEKRPDFGRPAGKPSESQKRRTAPDTAPAIALKRLLSSQPALAMTQAITSQRAEQQIRANVTRLLITLNHRDARPPRSAVAAEALMRMRKAASQDAAPAAKTNTNQSP